jgi:hypothetical protein
MYKRRAHHRKTVEDGCINDRAIRAYLRAFAAAYAARLEMGLILRARRSEKYLTHSLKRQERGPRYALWPLPF